MELTIDEALQQGVAAHKGGKLQEAERLYRFILQAQPDHPDANHNLGVLTVSANKAEAALPFFKAALEANPKIEQFWLSYIDALIKEKQLETAKQVLADGEKTGLAGEKLDVLNQQLIVATKEKAPSQAKLNSLLEHYQNGRYDDAEKLALSITKQFPNHPFSWKVLGVVFRQTGRKSQAVNANQKAVALSPEDAEAHNNLGSTLRELGRLEEGESSLRQAIALKSDYAESHYNLGNTLQELGRLDEAEASYRQAIALKSDYAESHYNLGNTLHELGRLKEAEASYKQAIELKSDYAGAHNNLGVTLKKQGKLDEAIEIFNKALASQPDNAELLQNLSNARRNVVPDWHIPMMNEQSRNEAYLKALNSAIQGDEVVLDIGTGAGLLSMMAADCGAKEIITCEMSKTISEIAEKIIQKNGFNHKIRVINKNSKDLILGQDMNQKADILVSEVLSSEFVGEGIQTTLLDAKKRLLKKNGKMIPKRGSIMIALIENTGKLARQLFVDNALGYDISDFNSLTSSKYGITLEDEPVFLSNPIEAFTFDFCNFENIYIDNKTMKIEVNKTGACAGVIQWLKVQLYDDIEYQNNPLEMYQSNSVSGWKTPIFKFKDPVNVTKGQALNIQAILQEDNSWFSLNPL